jgi:hypothetical protein
VVDDARRTAPVTMASDHGDLVNHVFSNNELCRRGAQVGAGGGAPRLVLIDVHDLLASMDAGVALLRDRRDGDETWGSPACVMAWIRMNVFVQIIVPPSAEHMSAINRGALDSHNRGAVLP